MSATSAAAGHGAPPASWEAFWVGWQAEHLGLHGFETMRDETSKRFDERAFVRAPFLYRLLGGVATEVLEHALIDAGAIQALAFRYAGVARPPDE